MSNNTPTLFETDAQAYWRIYGDELIVNEGETYEIKSNIWESYKRIENNGTIINNGVLEQR